MGNDTAVAIAGLADNVEIFALLLIPLLLLAGYWWRGSLLLGLAGAITTWLVWTPLKPYGSIYDVLLLIALIMTVLKMLYDVITSGFKI